MDLLRLVLARQSLDSLLRFPMLVDSDAFRIQRAKILGYSSKKLDFDTPSLHGELYSCSAMPPRYVTARALFLRDTETFLSVIDKVEELDFWLLLESDIPEVQAKAIASLIHLPHNTTGSHQFGEKIPMIFNDLTSINWTPRLETMMKDNIKLPISQLAGFLRMPLGDRVQMSCLYYVGLCRRTLNGEETTDAHPELENGFGMVFSNTRETHINIYGDNSQAFADRREQISKYVMLSGYLTPFTRILTDSKYRNRKLVKSALKYASYLSLKLILSSPGGEADVRSHDLVYSQKYGMTKWYHRRVLRILEDKEVVDKLPPETVNWYRAVAGEVFEASDPCRLSPNVSLPSIGIPSPDVNIWAILRSLRISSLQGISFRDPYGMLMETSTHPGSTNSGKIYQLLALDSYRKGRFFSGSGYYDSKREFKPAPAVTYRRVLAYLKGEAETWKD